MVINDGIRAGEVRLISSEGEQLGIVSREKALKMAEDLDLDLVLIAPNANPPVCKIMDYGKYCFEQEKREKEARKNQNIVEIKGVRLSPTIDEHDLNTKAKQAYKFLMQGDKVKASIRFRGRQIAHTEMGSKVLDEFARRVEEVGVVERRPQLEGRFMTMIVAPKNQK
ncbi:MAG: translation initiation factor IF-3 [Christensenellales bacterium]